MEAPEESIILYADKEYIEKEWTNKMQAISDRIMEPYIFPDSLQSQNNGNDLSNDFNAPQQAMHQKLSSMLESNYFGLSTKKSKWRSPLSLRGLRSEETDINELNKYLRFGEVSADQSKSRLTSASCLSVHNSQNMVIIGARPDARYQKRSNNGQLQIFSITVTENDDDDGISSIDNDPPSPGDSYLNGMGVIGGSNSWSADDHDVFIKQVPSGKWQIEDGIVSTDWRA